MDTDLVLERQGRLLLQVGVSMFLFTSFWGFMVPQVASPRIALSVHTLSALQAVMLLTEGLLWPKLKLSGRVSWIAFWCSLHSTFAILSAYIVAACLGIGNETIVLAGELPHGLARGTAAQENFIKILAYSSAPTGILTFTLLFWGLRGTARLQGSSGHLGG